MAKHSKGGPKRTTAGKLLTGTFRPDRAGNEPQPRRADKPPAPPDFLDSYAKRTWRRLAPELHSIGLLTEADRESFGCYCVAWSQLRAARKAIDTHGLTVPTEKGNVIQNPAVGTANRSMDILRAFANEFGCTPSSRGRMDVGERPKANPLEELLIELASARRKGA